MKPIPCPENLILNLYQICLTAGPRGLVLPPYKGAAFRGGFASTFRQLVCSTGLKECRHCLLKYTCPYTIVFESRPQPEAEALRNYENIPRPFILEPPLESKTEYAPGEEVAFNLILIGKPSELLPYFIVTLEEFSRRGIGKGRNPFTLNKIIASNPLTEKKAVIYEYPDRTVRPQNLALTARDIWEKEEAEAHRWSDSICLNFLTPTRITYRESPARIPEFHIIIRNLLRRISSLCYFHHGLEYKASFSETINRAVNEITLVRNETRWYAFERYSSRQEKRIPLEGFVGRAFYKGHLKDFYPLLRLGEIIHTGKGAVFGQGKFVIEKNIMDRLQPV